MATTTFGSGSYTHTIMAELFSDAAVKAILFYFYIIGICGFLAILASRTVLLEAQYQLKALADCQRDELAGPGPSDYASFDDGILEDGLHGSAFRSARMTAVKRVRSFAFFAPIPTFIAMIAIPLCLQLNDVGSAPLRIFSSIVAILFIHFTNRATLRSYFQLVQGTKTEQGVEDGRSASLEGYTPQEELARSCCLIWLYLRMLYYLCGVETKNRERSDYSGLARLDEAKLARFPEPIRAALRRLLVLSTTPLLANGAAVPQYNQADNTRESGRPPFFDRDEEAQDPILHDRNLSDSDSVTSIELGRQVAT